MTTKFFTLEEAHAILPRIREMILAANEELENLADDLLDANERYDRLEKKMVTAGIARVSEFGINELASDKKNSAKKQKPTNVEEADAEQRRTFDECSEKLADMQANYIKRLNYWVDLITEEGIVLRDLRSGLLDFPARQGNTEYYLCWQLGESEIAYWHLISDGKIGRKPLAVLIEYL